MNKKLGKFGEFVKQYEKARRSYPPELFGFLRKLLKAKKPLILDLGCGTGISSRQLAKIGTVIGCDPDPKMLRAAKSHRNSGVKKYIQASADNLPFADATFDLIGAFQAFHWFDDKKSIAEIRRVLKPGGLFVAISQTGNKSWGEGYRMALIKSIDREVAHFKGDKFRPREILKKSGFKQIKTKIWNKTEIYSVPLALNYVEAVSIWQSVPKALRARALKGLREYFKSILKKHGKIERRVTVKAVIGMR